MDNEAKEVPLIERLLSVPKNARLQINTPNALGCFDTQNIPVGPLCHEAAAALTHSLSGGGGEAGKPQPVAWCDPADVGEQQIAFYGTAHRWHKDGQRYSMPLYASPLPPQAGQGTDGATTPFADFIRNATPERKAEVFGKVMDKVADQQQAVIDADGAGGKTK